MCKLNSLQKGFIYMKRNFIKSICEFHMINYKEFCIITEIPYRTMQNWLYNERSMPEYMEKLIYNTFRVVYGKDIHDTFFFWYYTSDVEMAILYRYYTQSIVDQIESVNEVRREFYKNEEDA